MDTLADLLDKLLFLKKERQPGRKGEGGDPPARLCGFSAIGPYDINATLIVAVLV